MPIPNRPHSQRFCDVAVTVRFYCKCDVAKSFRMGLSNLVLVIEHNSLMYALSLSLSERAIKVISKVGTDRAAAILNYHLPPSQNFPAASSAADPVPVTFEGSVRTKFRQCLPPSLPRPSPFLPLFRYAFSLLARPDRSSQSRGDSVSILYF